MNGFSLQCGMLGGALTASGTQVVLDGPFGTLNNNYSGFIGIRFFVNSSITVTALSRMKVSGNSGTHTIKLWNDSNVELASTSVDMSTGTAGSFVSGAISPLFLPSGVFYRLGTEETNGGDQWHELGGVYTFDPVVGYNPGDATAYFGASVLDNSAGSSGEMFGPVGLEYS